MENTMKFLKKLKTELPYDLAIQLLGIHLKKMTTLVQNNTCTATFIAQSRYAINLSIPQQINTKAHVLHMHRNIRHWILFSYKKHEILSFVTT